MATTSLWKIECRLDKVISYTTNVEKTQENNHEDNLYKSLHNVVEYTKSEFKTEKQLYVTGINCIAENALQDMILTKKHFGKEKGILAFHGFQSFAEGEITAQKAHEIGVKLAEELWGDKYEVLVSTHLNTNHYHNHFVVNSVSFVDGIKYRNTVENYAMMRGLSDDLCKEYGLSVLEEKKCGKIDYTQYRNSYIQKSDYYTTTKEDVDFAIKQAYSYKNFEKILEKMGYTITIRAGKISLCRPPYKRNIRIERSFGEEYSISNITDRIFNSDIEKIPFLEKYHKPRRYKSAKQLKNKLKIDRGKFYKLYLHYCYVLKVFPKKKYTRVKMTPEMRKDIKKMDEISSQIKFLCRNKIKTTEDLFLYKKVVTDELKFQMNNRSSLRRKRQKAKEPKEKQKLCDEILDLSNKIKYLKEEVRNCEKIEEQSQKIKSNLKEMNEQEEKEKIKKKGEISR